MPLCPLLAVKPAVEAVTAAPTDPAACLLLGRGTGNSPLFLPAAASTCSIVSQSVAAPSLLRDPRAINED